MNPSDVDILGFLICKSKMCTFSAANGIRLRFARITCTTATIVPWVRTGCVVHLQFPAGRDSTVFDNELLHDIRNVDAMPTDATRHLSHRFVARSAMSKEWFARAFCGHRVWCKRVFDFQNMRVVGCGLGHTTRYK